LAGTSGESVVVVPQEGFGSIDILLVNGALDQSHRPAEAGGQPSRVQLVLHNNVFHTSPVAQGGRVLVLCGERK
jgi:hypothetical protein